MCRYQVPSSLLFAAGSTQLQLQEEQIAAAARRSYTCGAGAVQRLRSHADGRAAVRIDLLCRGREGQLGCGSDLRSSPVAWRSRRVHAHSSLFFTRVLTRSQPCSLVLVCASALDSSCERCLRQRPHTSAAPVDLLIPPVPKSAIQGPAPRVQATNGK